MSKEHCDVLLIFDNGLMWIIFDTSDANVKLYTIILPDTTDQYFLACYFNVI